MQRVAAEAHKSQVAPRCHRPGRKENRKREMVKEKEKEVKMRKCEDHVCRFEERRFETEKVRYAGMKM